MQLSLVNTNFHTYATILTIWTSFPKKDKYTNITYSPHNNMWCVYSLLKFLMIFNEVFTY